MAAYNSINGIPSSANRWLLTDILREEWGFEGFVVSDYGSIDALYWAHSIADSLSTAAKLAIEAGVDIELPEQICFQN